MRAPPASAGLPLGFGTNGYTLTNPDDANERTDYTYDPLGRQQTVTDSSHTPGTTTWTADTFTTTTYDPITGQEASVTTPQGTLHYAYDPATGRHAETWTDSNATTYGYDPQSRQMMVTKLNCSGLAPIPQATTCTSNEAGIQISVTLPEALCFLTSPHSIANTGKKQKCP